METPVTGIAQASQGLAHTIPDRGTALLEALGPTLVAVVVAALLFAFMVLRKRMEWRSFQGAFTMSYGHNDSEPLTLPPVVNE